MKTLLAVFLASALFASAGPLKVATYPARHSVKAGKAVASGTKATSKGLFAAAKAVLW